MQRIFLAINGANATCVLNIINDITAFEEIFLFGAQGTKARLYKLV